MSVYVRELARALGDNETQVDIFARQENGCPPAVQISHQVRLLHLDDPGAEGLRALRAAGVDLPPRYVAVHSHYWRSLGVARSLLGPLGVHRHVHTYHSLAGARGRAADAAGCRREQIEAEVDDVCTFVVSTDREHDLLARNRSPEADIRVVPPGVDHALFRPVVPRRPAAPPELVCVGRIDPAKGLDLAIQAFALAAGRLADPVRLRIVGGSGADHEGAEISRLRELARAAGISSRVSFCGAIPHAQLPDVYRRADALLVCSHRESFGLAMIEAQACGTPVVGTAVGILPELARRGGAILVSRDPEAVAEGIVAALEPARATSLREAGVRAARRYSWERMAGEILGVYERPTAR